MGRRLAGGFAELGDQVWIGTRDPSAPELVAWQRETGAKVTPAPFAEAAAQGQLLVLAALGSAVDSVLDLAGPKNFDGKLLLDATNPLDFSRGMPPGLTVGVTDSLGEQIQRRLPTARVVKCFNTVPNALMVHPKADGHPFEMLICGNDAKAKGETAEILRQFGWHAALDVGGIESARWLEALVPLWVRVGVALGDFSQLFQVVRAQGPPGSAQSGAGSRRR